MSDDVSYRHTAGEPAEKASGDDYQELVAQVNGFIPAAEKLHANSEETRTHKRSVCWDAENLDIFVETVHKDWRLRVKPQQKGQLSSRQQLRVP